MGVVGGDVRDSKAGIRDEVGGRLLGASWAQ